MKIFLLGDTQHPNAQNWTHAFRHYGKCEVRTWSLPWPEGKAGKLKRIQAWIKALFSLKKEIKAFAPDILIGYRLTSYGSLAAFTGIKPLVIAAQGETDVWPPGHWSIPIKRFLAAYAVKHADLVHAWAGHMAKSVYELGGTEERTLVLPRGIDLNNFNIEEHAKSFDQLNIIISRALVPWQRHDIIIRSIKKVDDNGIPVKVHIAGEGVEMNNIKQLCKELNIDNKIKFLGLIDKHILREYLLQSNIYVSMPITEGVSASLLEAMACYCIPVVTDLPGNRIWIEHHKNGFLIPVDDIEALSDALIYIFNNKDAMTALLLNNRKMVEEKGSMEKNTHIFLKYYQTLINKYNPTTSL